jgi:MFS family permease
MLMANSAAILTDAFPAKQRGFALGINQIAALAGCSSAWSLGGLLAAWDWRAVFWVNVPVGVFGTIWAYFKLRDTGVTRKAQDRLVGQHHLRGRPERVLVASPTASSPTAAPMGWTNPLVLGG